MLELLPCALMVLQPGDHHPPAATAAPARLAPEPTSLTLNLSICSYGAVLALSEQLQHHLSSLLPRSSGRDGPRMGIYAEAGVPYVASTWATWMSGGIAVPLATSHPPAELQYVMRDAGVSAVSHPT